MIESYPAEMILSGKEALSKWNEYFAECEEKNRINEQTKMKIADFQLKQKLKK